MGLERKAFGGHVPGVLLERLLAAGLNESSTGDLSGALEAIQRGFIGPEVGMAQRQGEQVLVVVGGRKFCLGFQGRGQLVPSIAGMDLRS